MIVLGTVLGFVGAARGQLGPARVVTAHAEMRALPATATLVGTVHPQRRTTLGAEVAGLVMDMPVRQGDLVEAGAIICRLNDDLLKRALDREVARMDARKARLEELEHGTRQEVIDRLKADLDAAEAMAERWDFELERIRRLHGEDIAAEREFQDALAEKRSAASRRDAAQAEHAEAVAGPRAEVIAQARFDVAEQEAEIARLQTEIDKTLIRAPFTGFVTVRTTEVGAWLSVGDPVVELIDLESVLVRVDVPEAAIAYATAGSETSVRIDALREAFSGAIRHVIPQADMAARTFPVEIELANPERRLKAGMFARATVPAGPQTEQLAVPKDAIIENRGLVQVALIVPGKDGKMAVPTSVTLGADAGEWVAVTSGNVPAGAELAVYGNERLLYPQPVIVVNTPAEAGPAAPAATPADAATSSAARG